MTRLDEYEAVRKRAGLIDASFLGVVRVGGDDRVTFLHNLLTQDINGLAPGSAAQAALVTPVGKLVSDMVVWAEPDAHWLIVPRARVEAVVKGLEHYLITEDVTLEDQTAAHAILALQGPASQDFVKDVSGARAIPYSLTGSAGFLLLVPTEQSARLEKDLIARGAPKVESATLNILRIEAGIPWYGVDMDESNLLPETGLQARAVSETKGCYVGQEVVARMSTYGSASRKLMGLVCEGSSVSESGDSVMIETETVGAVTSACFSPALQKPIALGYIKRPHYEAGTRVTIMCGAQSLPATLVKLPFV